MASTSELSVNPQLSTGIDVGGTKVHIMDNLNHGVHRYNTKDHTDLYEVFDDYARKVGALPANVVAALAGPRDDETGAVKLTNSGWPEFKPDDAGNHYPGTSFETVNDMVGTAAGVVALHGVDLVELKTGTPAEHGTKFIMAISTGVGGAGAVWDKQSRRYVFVPSEGGHVGFQPKNRQEANYLKHLQKRYSHASAELALSGKYGIESLVDHRLPALRARKLARAVSLAKSDGLPVGAVVREYALEDHGANGRVARDILAHMGAMVGSLTRDFSVAFNATGGIYLTGSVAVALGEYFAENTDFLKRFVHEGAVHAERLAKIPIYLVVDPHIAVIGALSLATQSHS